ncbi:MAG TPA: LysR family transcriptional regulator, partial [Cupriavidus sp.]|nr:LysR family transcriptional regulator [Cupriavidus sp.]
KSLVVGASSNIGIYLLQPYIKALQDKLANKIDVRIGKNIEIAALLETL